MKILFVNICEKRAYEGHKLADSEWINELAMLGDVDVICPSVKWYNEIKIHARVIPFDAELRTKGRKILQSKLINRGIIRRFNPYIHLSNHNLYKFVERLDAKNHYDIIFAAHLDLIMFLLHYRHSKIINKIFVLEHTPEWYENKYIRKCFDLSKNRLQHITMEKFCVPIYVKKYGVSKNRVHCIPHPYNRIKQVNRENIEKYEVIGLSNSNSPDEIAQIIKWELRTGFFRDHKIKVLLRSPKKENEFDDGWLTVIVGRLNLSFEDYYSYILHAKVLILPFDKSFGARTSGTIIDALSNEKCVIGTEFKTMVGYSKNYTAVCACYKNMNELGECIKSVLEFQRNTDKMQKDFLKFAQDRSLDSIKKYMLKAFDKIVESN